METQPALDFDQALRPGEALQKDILSRGAFAASVVRALARISPDVGYVIAIEGAWGSGKTSTLAMVEALLHQEVRTPVVVHFNPWLVGDRDSLLRQFLAQVTKALGRGDHARDGRRVAKELKAYSRVFDVVKLMPGAEPWASLVKAVIENVGDATASLAEYKTPDIERQKQKVQEELQAFSRPIVVFIDDIDRLFPVEVFEMIRIIKAVGDFRNVGYVVAWDSAYVGKALEKVNIPNPEAYVDKVVQIRMPLPALPSSARSRLINAALGELPAEATKSHFPQDEKLMSFLYFSGLRELLEQPRDVGRVFNTAMLIEPALRSEVALADIVGLAALMVKAAPVFKLLQRNPKYFVGRLPSDQGLGDSGELIAQGAGEREIAFQQCAWPLQVRRVVHYLFPKVAEAEDAPSMGSQSEVHGRLAHPSRLLIALQLAIDSTDVSRAAAMRFLHAAEERQSILASLTVDNCLEFLELVGVLAAVAKASNDDVESLCVTIARAVDREPFKTRATRRELFSPNAEVLALGTITRIVKAVGSSFGGSVAQSIVRSPDALTVAADLVAADFIQQPDPGREVRLDVTLREQMLGTFSSNARAAARDGRLLQISNAGFHLRVLARTCPSACPEVYAALKAVEPTLDTFATEILRHSFDSNKGQTYRLPETLQILEAYCLLEDFKAHAVARLNDSVLSYPARAAWQAVAEEKTLYAIDGSDAD